MNGLLILFFWVVLVPQSKSVETPSTDRAPQSRATFERFKGLDGTWIGKSTKGWTEKLTIHTITSGAVVEMRSFDAHPGETMLELVHMDGDRLMMTHYCVAKNQPRMVATSFADEGKTITFTFLDATNLPSRDKGHMDKAIYRFIDNDHFTAQWTWYQNGKEDWMELIDNVRETGTAGTIPSK